MPRHVGLPWVFNSQVDDLGLIAGPYATFLGQQYDPLWAKFEGKPLKVAPKCRHEQTKEYADPYAGVDPDCRVVAEGGTLTITEGLGIHGCVASADAPPPEARDDNATKARRRKDRSFPSPAMATAARTARSVSGKQPLRIDLIV